jgi:hypothetical protein
VRRGREREEGEGQGWRRGNREESGIMARPVTSQDEVIPYARRKTATAYVLIIIINFFI